MQKRRILLVDDEVDFAATMAMRLQLRGYEVTIAHKGEEALIKARDNPDLILLDVMMPLMNGYETCDRLRQNINTKNIPIIMLTAKSTPKDRIEGLHIGADDYITKSADMEELFARIEALLRRSNLFEEMEEDKAVLIEELKTIVRERSVQSLFQPIFYLAPRKLFAYEVLTHGPVKSALEDPEKLFQCALNYGMFRDLEVMYRKKALNIFGDLIDEKLLFFNASPYIIESDEFKEIISVYDNPGQIVFEITERAEIKNFDAYCQTLNSIKSRGFKIAIDDVGRGYSSLDSIAEIEPDYAKLDMALVRGIDSNPKKQNLTRTILRFCRENKITSIAEGIETKEELDTLIDMGAEAGQGFLLGRPGAGPLKE
ncbi:MAG: EAL domain-containing protein [Candidatus Omnitrophota bacterium]|nr:EAL domain-containing protein [Candidatus Omnitrophota bacterium]